MSESERQKKKKSRLLDENCTARAQNEGKEWPSVEAKYQIMALKHSRRKDSTEEFQ